MNRARNADHVARTCERFVYSTVKIIRLYDYQTWQTQLLRNSRGAQRCVGFFLYFAVRALIGWPDKLRPHDWVYWCVFDKVTGHSILPITAFGRVYLFSWTFFVFLKSPNPNKTMLSVRWIVCILILFISCCICCAKCFRKWQSTRACSRVLLAAVVAFGETSVPQVCNFEFTWRIQILSHASWSPVPNHQWPGTWYCSRWNFSPSQWVGCLCSMLGGGAGGTDTVFHGCGVEGFGGRLADV